MIWICIAMKYSLILLILNINGKYLEGEYFNSEEQRYFWYRYVVMEPLTIKMYKVKLSWTGS
jgi:hypothetical protein